MRAVRIIEVTGRVNQMRLQLAEQRLHQGHIGRPELADRSLVERQVEKMQALRRHTAHARAAAASCRRTSPFQRRNSGVTGNARWSHRPAPVRQVRRGLAGNQPGIAGKQQLAPQVSSETALAPETW